MLTLTFHLISTLIYMRKEGRLHLRTETKRSSTEHIAYLFTGLLVICKWQERCTTLSPNVSQPSVLRVKQRIPLDSIHVTDMAPIVQPNLPLYVGNTGTVTSSAVGAAVLAASSANACGVSMHLDDCVSKCWSFSCSLWNVCTADE